MGKSCCIDQEFYYQNDEGSLASSTFLGKAASRAISATEAVLFGERWGQCHPKEVKWEVIDRRG